MRVLWCGYEFPVARQLLKEAIPEHEIVVCASGEILDNVPGCEVLIPAMCTIDASIIEAGAELQLIHQFGAGLDGVDLGSARTRRIAVGFVPSESTGNAEAVAEMALLQLLALTRQLDDARASFRAGQLGVPVGRSLVGMTITVLGLGSVGSAVVVRLASFGVNVIGVGRRPATDSTVEKLRLAEYVPLNRLSDALSRSDALVVCCALNDETRGLVGSEALLALPRGSWLINVARGGVVDYAALRAALESGHLAGTGLDVFWREPFDPTDALFEQTVIATPHLGGVTIDSYSQMSQGVADNIKRLAEGRPMLNLAVPS